MKMEISGMDLRTLRRARQQLEERGVSFVEHAVKPGGEPWPHGVRLTCEGSAAELRAFSHAVLHDPEERVYR